MGSSCGSGGKVRIHNHLSKQPACKEVIELLGNLKRKGSFICSTGAEIRKSQSFLFLYLISLRWQNYMAK